jgi:two-component system response regulator FixJ
MNSDFLVHIIDDDEAARQSLAFLLTVTGFSVRLHESALAFLEVAKNVDDGGCCITDVRMPGMTGLELLEQMKLRSIHLPAIVITGHGDVPLAVEAMRSGAVDFIQKPFDEEAVLRAISRARERREDFNGNPEATEFAERVQILSVRERQVLEGLVAGKSSKTIACDLGISPRTVEVYRANLMTKMQTRNLTELVRMAVIAKFVASSPSTT